MSLLSSLHISPDCRVIPPRGDKWVFGTPQKAINGMTKLLRLTLLDQALPANSQLRQKKLAAIDKVWKDTQTMLAYSFDSAHAEVVKSIEGLGQIIPRLSPRI